MAPADLLAQRTADVGKRVDRWRQALHDGQTRWLAIGPETTVQDRVAGFAIAGPNRDDDAPTELELQSIYVRRASWGSGLADRLMEVAVGKEPASLWVFEENARALRFYRRHGFAADGVRKFDDFFGLHEIRLVRG
nr:GNAT family N-acetyltransferase [Kribbella sandramycini]